MGYDMTKRIGFACKYVDDHGEPVKELNFRGTTVAWLNRQTRDAATTRLWEIMEHNLSATRQLVQTVGKMTPELRMMRIGSDLLPVYTQADWSWFWQQADVRKHLDKHFAAIGTLARQLDVKLSFHPGQFTVLASESDDIVDRSIEEFEYHVDMARRMGYGTAWHDHGFKINVHISGRRGAAGIIAALPRLSPEARNLLTIENDENSHGLDATLELEKHVALVLDIHHHWIRTTEYIQPTDDRVKRVVDSWRGVRPTMHYSLSKESELKVMDVESLPDMTTLLESGHKKQKLRAHSNMMWNRAANVWALSFWPQADLMVEAKNKNLASLALYQQHLASIS
jgi:UV DNA damage repair endonuclease